MPKPIIDAASLPDVPNPWEIKKRGAAVLDHYVRLGDMNKVAALMGHTYSTATMVLHRALEKIPGDCKLHKLIYWRDFRGLVPPLKPGKAYGVFGLTAHQTRLMELTSEGRRQAEIAAELGISIRTVGSLMSRTYKKIPGDHNGQKLRNWRLAMESIK